jgi:hypothetical protein
MSQYNHGLRWAFWGFDPSRALHLLSVAIGALDWNVVVLIPSLSALGILSGLVIYLIAEKS